MNQTADATLTRVQIRQIFRRHKGSVLRTAEELGISHVGVSQWLKGRTTSARIAEAAQRRAHELLTLESLEAREARK